MTDGIEDSADIEDPTDVAGVTEVEDYPDRKRVGGLLAVGGFALITLFFYSGRRNSVTMAAEYGFDHLLLEGILAGLLAIVVGISVALSGYVTD